MCRISALALMLATATPSAGRCDPPKPDSPDAALTQVGEKQLLQVLHDRPQLQTLVVPGSPIWAWLVAAFADKPDGVHVQWVNVPTSSFNPSSAESSAEPDRQNNLRIIVDEYYKSGPQQGQPRNGEEMLSTLVFELLNIQSYKDKTQLRAAMMAGTIPRQDFILGAAKLEFRANLKTKQFYKTVFVPYCNQHALVPHPELWFWQFPDDFAGQIALYPHTYWYPWKYFGDMYDWAAFRHAAVDELHSGKFDQAIADFTKSINFGAESPYWRGVAELASGDEDHALADFSHSVAMPQTDASTRDESALLAWGILAAKGLKAKAAQQLVDHFSNRLTSPQKNDSPAQIALFLLDRTDEKTLLAEVAEIQQAANYQQVCVAWYYVATKYAVAGDKATALADFQKCVSTGNDRVAEFMIAGARVK